MNLLTIVVTATVGFAAAQLGAYLQFRRDQRTQRGRDLAEEARQQALLEAEAARLRQQLEAQATDAAAARAYSDLLDWRARRITAYRAVSLAASAVEHRAWAVRHLFGLLPKDLAKQRLELYASLEALHAALDEADVISEAHLRGVGARLWAGAEELKWAVEACGRAEEELADAQRYESEPEPAPDGSMGAMIAAFFRSRTRTVAEAQQARTEAADRWQQAHEAFPKAREEWAQASRRHLGVPD